MEIIDYIEQYNSVFTFASFNFALNYLLINKLNHVNLPELSELTSDEFSRISKSFWNF
jgi:hypothetical protein